MTLIDQLRNGDALHRQAAEAILHFGTYAEYILCDETRSLAYVRWLREPPTETGLRGDGNARATEERDVEIRRMVREAVQLLHEVLPIVKADVLEAEAVGDLQTETELTQLAETIAKWIADNTVEVTPDEPSPGNPVPEGESR